MACDNQQIGHVRGFCCPHEILVKTLLMARVTLSPFHCISRIPPSTGVPASPPSTCRRSNHAALPYRYMLLRKDRILQEAGACTSPPLISQNTSIEWCTGLTAHRPSGKHPCLPALSTYVYWEGIDPAGARASSPFCFSARIPSSTGVLV